MGFGRVGLSVCVLVVVALGMTSAACGAASPSGRGATTRLVIVYQPHGAGGVGGPGHRWTLTCDPVGGTLPSRVDACRELAAHGEDLIHPGVECMVIVRGGRMATVSGTWDGRAVHFVSTTCSRAWGTLPALLTGSG